MKDLLAHLRNFRVLAILAIVTLGVALHEYRRLLTVYREHYEWTRPALTRLLVTDRLIGAQLPQVELLDLDGRARPLHRPDTPAIYWFVKVGECPSCLGQRLARWHALTADAELAGSIVLVGASVEEARRIARGAHIRTETLVDPASAAVRLLGLDAPSVGVVVDGRGVVLLADARFAGTASRCGWSFFEQVRALYGGGDSERIRFAANTQP
ncbi:MAG TPA: hypothetical protein VF188_10240 [Longimicrobiales bacterium]